MCAGRAVAGAKHGQEGDRGCATGMLPLFSTGRAGISNARLVHLPQPTGAIANRMAAAKSSWTGQEAEGQDRKGFMALGVLSTGEQGCQDTGVKIAGGHARGRAVRQMQEGTADSLQSPRRAASTSARTSRTCVRSPLPSLVSFRQPPRSPLRIAGVDSRECRSREVKRRGDDGGKRSQGRWREGRVWAICLKGGTANLASGT